MGRVESVTSSWHSSHLHSASVRRVLTPNWFADPLLRWRGAQVRRYGDGPVPGIGRCGERAEHRIVGSMFGGGSGRDGREPVRPNPVDAKPEIAARAIHLGFFAPRRTIRLMTAELGAFRTDCRGGSMTLYRTCPPVPAFRQPNERTIFGGDRAHSSL